MQRLSIVIVFMVMGAVMGGWAADMHQQVPAKDAAYTHLRSLLDHGLLPYGDELLTGVPPRLVTRFEVSLALTDTLKMLVALTRDRETLLLDPAQRRRQELANRALQPLKATERAQLLHSVSYLAQEFGDVIDKLQPGLSAQAATAIARVPAIFADPDNRAAVSVVINPKATPEKFGDLLPVIAMPNTQTRYFKPGTAGNTTAVGAVPLTIPELKVNFERDRYSVYTVISMLPGQDLNSILKLDPIGRLKLGVDYEIASWNSLEISTMVQLQMQRTPDQIGTSTVDMGKSIGIGLSW